MLAALGDGVARVFFKEGFLQEQQLLFEGALEHPLCHISQRDWAVGTLVCALINLHRLPIGGVGLLFIELDSLDLFVDEGIDACLKPD